jgi:hypothetical protein
MAIVYEERKLAATSILQGLQPCTSGSDASNALWENDCLMSFSNSAIRADSIEVGSRAG